jgi:ribosomal protein S27AE
MNTSNHILNYQNNALTQYIQSINFGSTIKVFTSIVESNCDLLNDIRSAKVKIMLMIPKGQINAEYAEMILSEMHKCSQKGVSVVIVYDKSVLVPAKYQDLAIPSDKLTMPLLFVDNKVWYGLPMYKHDCSDSQVRYPILSDVIVRFSGKCTVEMIKSFVEHANVKPPVTTGLALYVRNHCECSRCSEPMTLVKSNKFFMKCKQCGNTQMLSTNMVNRYLDSIRGKCPRCGKDLYAANGQYDVYVRCSDNHTSKLDEI